MLLYVYLYVFLYLYVYLYVSKCLVLSVVVPMHFICFTVGEWEMFLSIPCMSDMQEIDNKATLTLTTLTLTSSFPEKTRSSISQVPHIIRHDLNQCHYGSILKRFSMHKTNKTS